MTPRRRHILQLVNDAIALTGVSPSLVEMAAHTNTTHGAVCRHVQALEETGFLRRVGGAGAPRSLEVLRMPGIQLTADEIAWCQANPERVRAMIKLVSAA